MNISSSINPHEMCTGIESVASNANELSSDSSILNSLSLDFFFSERENRHLRTSEQNIARLSKDNFPDSVEVNQLAAKNEILSGTFSLFSGTWNYSEVD